MNDILLKQDGSITATCVPNTFIDKYMTHADGEYVKIYLYLLRCLNHSEQSFSISAIADKFDYTEKDVKRALKYWEKAHLLRMEFDSRNELAGICLTDAVNTPVISIYSSENTENTNAGVPADAGVVTSAACRQLQEHPAYTPNELLQFVNDETVQERLFVAERYLGHPLNDTETRTILYWMDKLGFSQDLIDYLLEFCAEKEHKNIQYMNTIAISWAAQGIRTVAGAKQASNVHSHTVHAVMKAFGISNRGLADYELDYIHKWHELLGFSDELIVLACQKTLRSINKVSFSYAESILTGWKKQNVHTTKDVELLDSEHQKAQLKKFSAVKKASSRTARSAALNEYTNFPQRTYNYEELERQLLSR